MMRKKRKSNKEGGFTLVELIVAVAIFAVLAVSATDAGLSLIKTQRRVLAGQGSVETLRYILETVSKEIRMSSIASDAGEDLSLLSVVNSDGEAVTYQFVDQEFRRNDQRINPANIEITGGFYVKKSVLSYRALVTITIKAAYKSEKTEESIEIYVQNTISPRTY